MIIGVDDRTTKNQYRGRGIGKYTQHIIEWLPKVGSDVRVETKDFSRIDIFLQPNFWDGFPKVSCPQVLMIHDLTPLATNHFTERGALINFLKNIKYRLKMRNIKQANAVLTNSEQTKKDVIKYAGIDAKIVHRVYLGVDEEFRTSGQEVARREERGNYILFVGGVEANKNVIRLLEAFHLLRVQSVKFKVQNLVRSLKLMMPGGQFVDKDKIETRMIRAKVKELGLEYLVEFPGFVEPKELIELYRRALVFVYPSYYEGFGFPVLEAMASGTPVVTSNVSSLPEVAGGAAVFVNPYDIEDTSRAIVKVLNYYTTKYEKYEDLLQRGLAQSKKFSWEKCARETLGVLKSYCYNH